MDDCKRKKNSITVCLVITNYDINGQNNENVEKRVVRLSFLMKGRVIMNLVIAEKPSVAQSIAKVPSHPSYRLVVSGIPRYKETVSDFEGSYEERE